MLNPSYGEEIYNYGNLKKGLDGPESAIKLFSEPQNNKIKLPQTHIQLAIYCYIKADYAGFIDHLNMSDSTRNSLISKQQIKFVDGFTVFLRNLYKWAESNAELYVTENYLPPLYCFGESHSLVPTHLKLQINNQQYRGETKIILGCKAWHLANEHRNLYKREFEVLVESIPPGSAVLMMIGEIDCRYDEGILKSLKGGLKDLKHSILNLASSYVDYVSSVLENKNITPMFYGVPAPFTTALSLSDQQSDELIEVIFLYNKSLNKICLENKFIFIDIYSATNDNNGTANGSSHLDNYHILPSAFLSCLENIAP